MHARRGMHGIKQLRIGAAGLGGHDEPYDPLVFALRAMMSLLVYWALELAACLLHRCSCSPQLLSSSQRCCLLLSARARVYARLERTHT